MRQYIKIHEKDNVAVALTPLSKNTRVDVDGRTVILSEDIMQGHKFALFPICAGENIIKYGAPIGVATQDVVEGGWVHVHNIKTRLGDMLEYSYQPEYADSLSDKKAGDEKEVKTEEAFFMGYRRADGRVGVRNELWIIPTVGCVNSVVKEIEKEAKEKFTLHHVEDIIAFNHPYGCSQMGDDQENTRKVLADMIRHPNAGAVLVVGLGCENCNIPVLKEYIGEYDSERVQFLICQETEDEIETALSQIEKLLCAAEKDVREKCSAADLVIGMKCGGSDGLSGITANPLVGRLSDLVIEQGGTTILTEVPEMFGAETLLMSRCVNRQVFEKTVKLINDFKQYFKDHNQTIYENPSPGNKQGGISTLEDKSLGCTQKSGSAKVSDVLAYAQPVKEKGLNLLSAPGNDLVASTALGVSGAQIVLFTTGRGTPFASLVPTVKISSNSALSMRKNRWIDFNAGELVEGKPMDVTARELFAYILRVASGEKVKSEQEGYHDIAIFKQGVTL